MKSNTITILGAGYVGISTAALLSNCGYKVFLVDVNQERLDAIASGKSFFYEEGIDPLIKEAVEAGTLIPTENYAEAVPKCSVVFSCVGTPDNPDGSSNLAYVFASAREAVKYMNPGSTFVQKSTVPVGTGKKIIREFEKSEAKVFYVSNPEFLREGTAISDTLWFDRVVCGGTHKQAIEKVFSIYKSMESSREILATISGLKRPDNPVTRPYISTSLQSAELIKVTSNAFLALKISFANSIAKLSDQVGADISEVMDAVGQDQRIGRAFLNAGRGYGGGCFPKDMSGLIDAMHEHGADPQILTAAQDVNASMPGYIANKLQSTLGKLEGKKFTVLGLAFKAGTSDARKSPGVIMANILSKAGAEVSVYDPEANHEAEADLRTSIVVCRSAEEAAKDAHAILVATDWPEFVNIKEWKATAKYLTTVVDCMNCLDRARIEAENLTYLGVGR